MNKFKTQEELFSYLKANKSTLIAEKQLNTKFTDSLQKATGVRARTTKPTKETKDSSEDSSSDPALPEGTLEVVVVCNTANFVDSHMDMLTKDAYTASVDAKGTSIPHIADHRQSSTSHVGDVTAVYTKDISLKDLGYNGKGSTTALVMETTIRKDYNPDVYKFYKNGKIDQHSIGLRYGDMAMAINSKHEDYVEELAVWDEYYPQVINKEAVDTKGYFWVVKEVDVIENSCVLFGANSLTPTLAIKSDTLSSIDINFKQQHIGETMNLEEALSENIKLTAKLQESEVKVASAVALAKAEEQTRVVDILSAAKTFTISNDSALKFIKSNTTVDMAVMSFEAIKEATQGESHVDTSSEGLKTTLTSKTLPVLDTKAEVDFKTGFMNAFDSLEKEEQLFVGVR
jgi:hypothetical protein